MGAEPRGDDEVEVLLFPHLKELLLELFLEIGEAEVLVRGELFDFAEGECHARADSLEKLNERKDTLIRVQWTILGRRRAFRTSSYYLAIGYPSSIS